MIKASSEFEKRIEIGAKLVNYLDITLRDGTVLNIGPESVMNGGFSLADKTTNGSFSIGNAVGKIANFRLANHNNQFSKYDFFKSIIYAYVAMQLENGTIEKVRKGKYYVTVPETPGDTISIQSVDSMCLFDKQYKAATVFPATLQNILSDCCVDCGVNIGFGEFPLYNLVVNEKPEDCTYRQVVSWVAQIAGKNARINNNDALELVWFEEGDKESVYYGGDFGQENEVKIVGGTFDNYETDLIIKGGDFDTYTSDDENAIKSIKKISVNTDDVIITGVKIESEGSIFLEGTEEYAIKISDNPLLLGKENEVLSHLSSILIGIKFRPLSAQILNNPLIEPYDVVIVSDRKGRKYKTYINSVSYKISGYTDIASIADNPIRSESSYTSEAAKAIVAARKNTQKELSRYDAAVQNMNMIAMNAMGYHTSYEDLEDGSRITYLHDKPLREDSTIIYMQTIDGFFLSQDGGTSYTAGFDSEGNAVVNILSAIGIIFDWAKGGTLTLGGADDQNGVINMLDGSGILKGKWTKDGIEMQQEDGSVISMTPADGFYRLVGSTKHEYNSLYYATTVSFSGTGEATITLPDEFKNKRVKAIASLKSIGDDSSVTGIRSIYGYGCSADYNSDNNTIKVKGYGYGHTAKFISENVSYISSINTYETDFLTYASLSYDGSNVNTQSADGISSIIPYYANTFHLKDYSLYDSNPTLTVSVIALA